MSLVYRETIEYVPVDADKGLDRLTGQWVKADAAAPAGYTQLPRCAQCANYTAGENMMGTCEASKNTPKFFAYADMICTTCEDFKFKA